MPNIIRAAEIAEDLGPVISASEVAEDLGPDVADDECDSCKAGGPCTGCGAKPHAGSLYVDQDPKVPPPGVRAQMPQMPLQGAAAAQGAQPPEPGFDYAGAARTAFDVIRPGGVSSMLAGSIAREPEGSARAAAQGLTLRGADELTGLGGAVVDREPGEAFLEAYRRHQQESEANYARASAESGPAIPALGSLSPSTYDVVEAGAGMALPMGAIGRFSEGGKSVLGTALRAGSVGAGTGAIAGALGSESNLSEEGGYGDVTRDAFYGAAIGGPLAALIGGGARAIGNRAASKAGKAREFADKGQKLEGQIRAEEELPKLQRAENQRAARETQAQKSAARREAGMQNEAQIRAHREELAATRSENQARAAQAAEQKAAAKAEAEAETARRKQAAVAETREPNRDEALQFLGLDESSFVNRSGGTEKATTRAEELFDVVMGPGKGSKALTVGDEAVGPGRRYFELEPRKRVQFVESTLGKSGNRLGQKRSGLSQVRGAGVERSKIDGVIDEVLGDFDLDVGDNVKRQVGALLDRAAGETSDFVHASQIRRAIEVAQRRAKFGQASDQQRAAWRAVRRKLVDEENALVQRFLPRDQAAAYTKELRLYRDLSDLSEGAENLRMREIRRAPEVVRYRKPGEIEPAQPRAIADPELRPEPMRPERIQPREVQDLTPEQLRAPEFPGGKEAMAQIAADLDELGPANMRQALARIGSEGALLEALDRAGAGYATKLSARSLGRLLGSRLPRERGPITLEAKVAEAVRRAAAAEGKSARLGPEIERILRKNPRALRAAILALTEGPEAP
jgi:hypothetical protein